MNVPSHSTCGHSVKENLQMKPKTVTKIDFNLVKYQSKYILLGNDVFSAVVRVHLEHEAKLHSLSFGAKVDMLSIRLFVELLIDTMTH